MSSASHYHPFFRVSKTATPLGLSGQALGIVFYSAVHLCLESHSCQRLSQRLSVVCSFRAGVLNKGVPGVYIYIYGALYVLWPFHPAEV